MMTFEGAVFVALLSPDFHVTLNLSSLYDIFYQSIIDT